MNKIIISRTDSIGDVVLTLPLAGAIKRHLPKTKILFLVKSYVKPVVELSEHIDEIIILDEIEKLPPSAQLNYLQKIDADVIIHVFPKKFIAGLAKKARIPIRIGTNHRSYHWLNCNKLISLGRKKSPLHEAQLNLKLLQPLGIKGDFSFEEIEQFYGISASKKPGTISSKLLSTDMTNIILHPTSRGSAREWGHQNFRHLIDLYADRANIIITGSQEDEPILRPFLNENITRVKDAVGVLNLNELIELIAHSQILVAASTGPLHIAAALGIKAIGIFPPMRPIHPGRWKPVGKNAEVLVVDRVCSDCKKSGLCHCMQEISADMVAKRIDRFLDESADKM